MDSTTDFTNIEERESQCIDDQMKSLALTNVQYLKGDFLGYVLAWFSLVPFFLCIAFLTLIAFRRDLHTISFFTGILLDEGFNWILKHTIREYRPAKGISVHTTEFGMPSSHSQFMFFFATYIALFLCIRVHRNFNFVDDLWKYVLAAGSIACAFVVMYSRLYLGYHTVSQVSWGSLVGLLLGCVWFGIVQIVLTPFFPYIASSPLGEMLMLRDSTLIPHVLWFEYTSSRSESRNRQRKVTSRKSQ